MICSDTCNGSPSADVSFSIRSSASLDQLGEVPQTLAARPERNDDPDLSALPGKALVYEIHHLLLARPQSRNVGLRSVSQETHG